MPSTASIISSTPAHSNSNKNTENALRTLARADGGHFAVKMRQKRIFAERDRDTRHKNLQKPRSEQEKHCNTENHCVSRRNIIALPVALPKNIEKYRSRRENARLCCGVFFADYSSLPISEARLQNACHFSLTPEPVWREMEICRPSSRYRLFFSMRLA